MLISPTHGFIFIHIPKTAGTSVQAALEPHASPARAGPVAKLRRHLPGRVTPRSDGFSAHVPAAAVRARLGPEVWDRSFSFAFVRNPYTHAWSHYRFLQRYRHARIARQVRAMDFEAYLAWRIDGAARRPHGHVARIAFIGDQTAFVTDAQGTPIVTRLCRFERLDAEMAALARRFGLPALRLPHIHARDEDAASLAAAMTPAAVAIIDRLHARDFALFGYRRVDKAGSVAEALGDAAAADQSPEICA